MDNFSQLNLLKMILFLSVQLLLSQVRAGKDNQMMLEGQKWLFGGAKIRYIF